LDNYKLHNLLKLIRPEEIAITQTQEEKYGLKSFTAKTFSLFLFWPHFAV